MFMPSCWKARLARTLMGLQVHSAPSLQFPQNQLTNFSNLNYWSAMPNGSSRGACTFWAGAFVRLRNYGQNLLLFINRNVTCAFCNLQSHRVILLIPNRYFRESSISRKGFLRLFANVKAVERCSGHRGIIYDLLSTPGFHRKLFFLYIFISPSEFADVVCDAISLSFARLCTTPQRLAICADFSHASRFFATT